MKSMQDIVKRSNICAIRVSQGFQREMELEARGTIFEEVMTKHFLKPI